MSASATTGSISVASRNPFKKIFGGRTPESKPVEESALKLSEKEEQALHEGLLAHSDHYKATHEHHVDRQRRLGLDMTLRLGLNQAPTVIGLIFDRLDLKGKLGLISPIATATNVVVGAKLCAEDIREIRHAFTNTESNRTDKSVDVAHFGVDVAHVMGDALLTAAWLVPAILLSPTLVAAFTGVALTSLGSDIGKTIYDYKREKELDKHLDEHRHALHQAMLASGHEGTLTIEHVHHALNHLDDVDTFLQTNHQAYLHHSELAKLPSVLHVVKPLQQEQPAEPSPTTVAV